MIRSDQFGDKEAEGVGVGRKEVCGSPGAVWKKPKALEKQVQNILGTDAQIFCKDGDV